MEELRIRVDSSTKAMIMEQAKKNGVSMSQYVGIIVTDYMKSPELRAAEDRYATTFQQIIAAYHEQVTNIGIRLGNHEEILARIYRLLAEKEEHPW